MARVFVSYSRKNKDFCKRLTDELQNRDIEFWVDWDDIPPTVDWRKEIQTGIEDAVTFIAIVSPDWIFSPICLDELEIAVKNGKRLIPVVPCDIVWDSVPPALAQLNFIFFTENFDFNQQLEKLITALDTDYGWLKTHSRLQVKALEWERSNKENGFLLHGRDLEEAEQQISINANKNPNPTALQREYVLRSRQETERQRKISRIFVIALVIVLLGIIGLLVRPFVADEIAQAHARNLTEMISVPAGNINIQVADKSKTVDVHNFRIETQPISKRVYDLCVKVDKCDPPIGTTTSNGLSEPEDPVVWLTIVQSAAYCEWIGRRLPTAAEWELAAIQFAPTSPNDSQFSLTEVWEWTSSYRENSPQAISGDWDGQLENLIFDWSFIQQGGILDPSNKVGMYKNTGGALGVTAELGFRCVEDD
jgi:hypothetical protein